MDPFRKSFYAGIFLVAASTLLLEITLTKIFSVIHFHYFAFFIVSTALFGYGFSGVFLSVSKRIPRISKERLLFVGSLLFAITTILSYRVILATPLRISDLLSTPTQILYLAIVYLMLALPFFFSGFVIGVLLTYFSEHINKLYFADLTGAAIGCFAIVGIIPLAGGSGTILVAAIVAALAALAFARNWKGRMGTLLLIGGIAILIPYSESLFPSVGKSEKRHFQKSLEEGRHLYSGWSPASRIDVVSLGSERLVIWIDGGTNQSFMARLRARDQLQASTPKAVWKTVEIPFALVQDPKVLIIGPGGGVEVASALSYKPKSIVAVELDPLITKIVLGRFSGYIGHIYRKPNVKLINEEGRSYIRRSGERFDIIQQKNNSHPMAVASGALNLSETYLLTKEAFHEYLDHLTPGGFLSIERHGGIRLLNLAAEVWKERGVRDYWKRLVLINEDGLNQVFIMKNGDFNDQELEYIHEYVRQKKDRPFYTPARYATSRNVFTDMMREEKRAKLVAEAPYHLEAPTDNEPFMEHFFKLSSLFSTGMKEKLNHQYWDQAALGYFTKGQGTYSDLSVYVILLEAILLSTVFIIWPLVKLKKSGVQTRGAWHLLVYFFALGVAFILIEISLIQKYILFLGYPVYAVAVIIFSLLIAAGAGSFFSSRYVENPFKILRIAVGAILVLTILQVVLVPMLFRQFLSASFASRVALSVVFIFPAGFFMGMPFPVGLTWISRHHPAFVPWAWGINGYATVIGSVLSVILALNFGFRAVLFIAAGIYLLAFFVLKSTPAAVGQPADSLRDLNAEYIQ